MQEVQNAITLSIKLYGEKSLPTSQAMYLYGMILSKIKSRAAEFEAELDKAEDLMEEIAGLVQSQENCNMLFNILCDYSLNLNNFVTDIGPERRIMLHQKLQTQLEINSTFRLHKEAFLIFLSIYIEEDPAVVLAKLEELHVKLQAPDSEIPCPSYIEIMVKFFKANL